MLDVEPFCSLRYSPEQIPDLSLVICPPYDLISPEEQQLYYQKCPYNMVRLELGKDLPSDSPNNNKYTRAATFLKGWLQDGILIRDQHPAFYLFQHRFVYRGVAKKCWGLTARVRLNEWSTGNIRPHEAVSEEYKSDRLHLLRACQVNLNPILAILRHQKDSLDSLLSRMAIGDPILSVEDNYGVIHNMWIVSDEGDIAEVRRFCADKTLYIADGHHRYETALIYQKEQHDACPSPTESETFNFVMMTLMGCGDPGLLTLPTHRLVRLPLTCNVKELEEKLNALFYLEELPQCGPSLPSAKTGGGDSIIPPVCTSGADSAQTLASWLNTLNKKDGGAIGLYGLRGKRLCSLVPRDRKALRDMMPSTHSPAWKGLDVSILHHVILGKMMGISGPKREREFLNYTIDELEAISQVDSGNYQLAFLLNPIPIPSVLEVADAGDRMPRKSTYFYPKLPTGLVMNPVGDL